MTPLAMIRHAPTVWNEKGRIQGHKDIPLSQTGRQQFMGCRLPSEFQDFEPVTSPLRRTMDTANLLGLSNPRSEPALIEMHWGLWEGILSQELRHSLGSELTDNEAQGLDFTPPQGESPRQVQQRLLTWFMTVAQRGRPLFAVTHKGVIRATLALATGWDMLAKSPIALDWRCIQLFLLDENGLPQLERFNIPLLNRS